MKTIGNRLALAMAASITVVGLFALQVQSTTCWDQIDCKKVPADCVKYGNPSGGLYRCHKCVDRSQGLPSGAIAGKEPGASCTDPAPGPNNGLCEPYPSTHQEQCGKLVRTAGYEADCSGAFCNTDQGEACGGSLVRGCP